jgi:hypothetical protein
MVDVPEWVEPAKVNESFVRWCQRFLDELGHALKQAAPEIEGKTQAQIREILLRVYHATLVRQVDAKFCQSKLDQRNGEEICKRLNAELKG